MWTRNGEVMRRPGRPQRRERRPGNRLPGKELRLLRKREPQMVLGRVT
jgi:hypothetical protein